MGHQAVAEQCRAIDAWRAEIGKAKQEPKPDSTAALEAKIEALCRERMEQAYRDISGKQGVHHWCMLNICCPPCVQRKVK